jgi:hypothetical protein
MNSKQISEIMRRPASRELIIRQTEIILKLTDNIVLSERDISVITKATREIRDICFTRWK